MNRYVIEADARFDRLAARFERRAELLRKELAEPAKGAAPEPLTRPLPPPAAYPIDALGPVLAPAARAIQRVVQSPAALCGQSVLAAASLCAQRLADVEIDGRRMPLSLWALTIAASGERKTGSDTPALAEIRAYEREQIRAYGSALEAHKAACREWQRVQRAEGTAEAEPQPPLNPIVITAEPTVEGMHKLLIGGTGVLGLFSDEGGAFVGGHAMSKEHQLKTVAGLSGLWDRGEADRVRAGDGAAKIYGKRLAMHLMLQPVVAERMLNDPVLIGQGFLARCLIAWPESTAGRRQYVAESLDADRAMIAYRARLREILKAPMSLAEGTRNELEPRVLLLTRDAKELWVAAHNEIERRQAPSGEYAQVRPWASKAAEQIARVAGVLAVLDNRSDIDATTIERAGILVDWHLGEAVRLVGTSHVPTNIRDAEQVLGWCHERELTRVHSSQLVRLGPPCVRTADRLHTVMGVLERHGWADKIEDGAVVDGAHRRHVWCIHPRTEG